jgi:hypothetical protein
MKYILMTVAIIIGLALLGMASTGQIAPMGMHKNMMSFTVEYEDVANGVRLTLTPKDPARLETFRAEVRRHVEHMQEGECPMMGEGMHRMMQ